MPASTGSEHNYRTTPSSLCQPVFNGCRRNYSITELEALAVVWAVTRFHSYLCGQSVTVVTDHTTVKAVLETPNPSAKHARWWTRVYGTGLKDVRIVYRPGRLNATADALSRSCNSGGRNSSVSEKSRNHKDDTIEDLLVQPPRPTTAAISFAEEQRRDPEVAPFWRLENFHWKKNEPE